jgi:hypothetical protein
MVLPELCAAFLGGLVLVFSCSFRFRFSLLGFGFRHFRDGGVRQFSWFGMFRYSIRIMFLWQGCKSVSSSREMDGRG